MKISKFIIKFILFISLISFKILIDKAIKDFFTILSFITILFFVSTYSIKLTLFSLLKYFFSLIKYLDYSKNNIKFFSFGKEEMIDIE